VFFSSPAYLTFFVKQPCGSALATTLSLSKGEHAWPTRLLYIVFILFQKASFFNLDLTWIAYIFYFTFCFFHLFLKVCRRPLLIWEPKLNIKQEFLQR